MSAAAKPWLQVRPVAVGEIETFLDVFDAAWGFARDDRQRRHTAAVVAAERPLAAFADGGMAGTAMSFEMELTVPGHAMPMAGVSYVAVHPLRRRRGVLRALMRAQLDDLHARGIPLAGLGASEGGIYGRFGYGPATWASSWRLARGAARGLAGGCQLEMIDAPTARDLLPAIHEQGRRSQVGDVRTYPGRWHDLAGDGAAPGTQFLLCRDDDGRPAGYAIYRLHREERYSPHASVIVYHLIALTSAAYRTLWAHLSDMDLTDQVLARDRPEHEPLRWALADGRQLAVTSVHDHLWLRLVDIPAALSGRRYAAEGSLVLEVADPSCPWNEGRWLLEGGPDGATCRPAGHAPAPGLRLDAATLGSLFLGGTSVTRLASAGSVEGDPVTVRKAQLMFATGTDPWCSTKF